MTKSERLILAKKHVEEMEIKYGYEIKHSQINSKFFNPVFEYHPQENIEPNIVVEDLDSVSAVLKYGGENAVLLNFASYKHPGGGFIKGTIAQEEAICHESTLYNVLSDKRFASYYSWNNIHLNDSLYLNRAIFSPGVIFERDKSVSCSVITCAAPNKTASSRKDVSFADNTEVLRSRIRFIIDIAMFNNIKTLILGAFGCGVFGQDPTEVANIFKKEINRRCNIENIIFAIPSGKDSNLEEFKKCFS